MSESIFSRIIRGEIPCHKVYEDADVIAFLDIGPLAEGHTLVVPKEPAPMLDTLSDGAAAAVGRCLPRLCRAVMAATGARACNVLQNNGAAAGQEVMHVHFHIIPRFPEREQGGLKKQWTPGSIDHAEAAALAARMAELIG